MDSDHDVACDSDGSNEDTDTVLGDLRLNGPRESSESVESTQTPDTVAQVSRRQRVSKWDQTASIDRNVDHNKTWRGKSIRFERGNSRSVPERTDSRPNYRYNPMYRSPPLSAHHRPQPLNKRSRSQHFNTHYSPQPPNAPHRSLPLNAPHRSLPLNAPQWPQSLNSTHRPHQYPRDPPPPPPPRVSNPAFSHSESTYKTKLCQRRDCQTQGCHFAHSRAEQRCIFYWNRIGCKNGRNCSFMHD